LSLCQILNEFPNLPFPPNNSGTNSPLLVGPLSDEIAKVNNFEKVVIFEKRNGCVRRHAPTDRFDNIWEFHSLDGVVRAYIAPENFNIPMVRINVELFTTCSLPDGSGCFTLGSNDNRNAVFGHPW
jgi:hypothetical protein